jgi:hypothetical protein
LRQQECLGAWVYVGVYDHVHAVLNDVSIDISLDSAWAVIVADRFVALDYPGDIVRLSCAKCGRAGQHRKQTLIKLYGADFRLPDLREEIAQCERRGLMHDACMVRYLLPK